MRLIRKISKNKPFVIIVLVFLIFLLIAKIGLSYYEEPIMFSKADFTVFYVTANHVFDDESIYNNQNIIDEINKLRGADGSVRYLYAPIGLIFFIPLTLFSLSTAAWLWLIINIILLLITIYLLQKIVKKHFTLWQWNGIVLLLLFFSPFIINLRTGQINILLTFLFILFIFLLQKKKNFAVGFILALISWIKLFPIILIFYFILKKQYKIIAYTIISIILLAIPIFGLSNSIDYINTISNRTFQGIHMNGLARYDNPTLNGLMYRIALINENNNPLKQTSVKSFWDSFNKLEARFKKTNLAPKEKTINIIKKIYCFILIIVLIFFSWITIKNKSKEYILDLTMWLGFVFLMAVDAHRQYFIMLLPLYIYYLTKKNTKPIWVLLGLSLIFITFSEAKFMPFIENPAIIQFLPMALLANLTLIIIILLDRQKRILK